MVQEQSVAAVVREVVDADPYLRECLRRGLANISEAARRIRGEVEARLGRPVTLDAVKAALARYARRLSEGETELLPPRLMRVIAESSVELRADINVAVVKLEAAGRIAGRLFELAGRARLLLLLQTINKLTVIADNDAYKLIRRELSDSDIVEEWRGQSAIVIVSPRDIVDTPGFIAYITGLLASRNINIQQIESVHTDTVIVVSSSDALEAYKLLRDSIEQARRTLAGH